MGKNILRSIRNGVIITPRKRNQVEHIEGNYQLMIGNGGADSGGKLDIFIEKKECKSVGSDGLELTVEGDCSHKIGGNVSETISQDHHEKVGMNHALEAGQEVHIKGGMNVIIEAGMQLTLKAGSNFVSIGPMGVDISGSLVNINSGGAPGSGSGCQPTEPQSPEEAAPSEPDMADDSETGKKSCD